MDKIKTLRDFGLFDAKVPRYTSYPPANRFLPDVGRRNQLEWLEGLNPVKPVSIYVHIPFCRRLCWFCACRTQGTQSLRPVEIYLEHLLDEIKTIAAVSPPGLRMARLHLGGGTPTLLSSDEMARLLTALYSAFPKTGDHELSVEVDPTEAKGPVLETLSDWMMTRASVGVQDFDPNVQDAIGRRQSIVQTEDVIARLRTGGVQSLNIDLLYGLPFQTAQSLSTTLDRIAALRPDRIALYGYAHVPHMSKRQVMIPDAGLPGPEARYQMAQMAGERLKQFGYQALGIDHFALPQDSLALAARQGKMHRNFQGYTDDPCDTLIGLGASAISKFPEGYVQNAVATAAYQQRTSCGDGLAGHKGYKRSAVDMILSEVIDQLMCNGQIDFGALRGKYPDFVGLLDTCQSRLTSIYSEAIDCVCGQVRLRDGCWELARLMAASLDDGLTDTHVHSIAI